jgi:hypothetical protein
MTSRVENKPGPADRVEASQESFPELPEELDRRPSKRSDGNTNLPGRPLSPVKDDPAVAAGENSLPSVADADSDADLSPVKEMNCGSGPEGHEPAPGEPTLTREDWINAINEDWQRGVRSPLQTGRRILAAERAGHSDPKFRRSFHFGPQVYSKLKSIAKNEERFTDANLKRCPPYYSSQYELVQLPRGAFDAAIASGDIHPSMTRMDAIRLREASSAPPMSKATRQNTARKQNPTATAKRIGSRALAEVIPGEGEATTTTGVEVKIQIAPDEKFVAALLSPKKLKPDEVRHILRMLDAIVRNVSELRVVKSSTLDLHD